MTRAELIEYLQQFPDNTHVYLHAEDRGNWGENWGEFYITLALFRFQRDTDPSCKRAEVRADRDDENPRHHCR